MGTVTCELEASYAATAGDGRAKLAGDEQRRLTFACNGKGNSGRRLGDGIGGPWCMKSMFLRRRRANAAAGMQVFVRTVDGKSLALDVSPYDTVDAVKARIQAKERVAAAEQRLVFAGRDLDDGSRALGEYGVRKEANLFLHLRLRGGAGAGLGGDVGAGAGGGSRRWAAAGLIATVVAVAAALPYLPAAAAAAAAAGGGSSSNLTILAFLLFAWALAIGKVNLITAGTSGVDDTLLCRAAPSAALTKAAAFARQNLSVLGVAAASSAAAGVIILSAAGADRRVHCLAWFGLFLVSMSVVHFSVASCAR